MKASSKTNKYSCGLRNILFLSITSRCSGSCLQCNLSSKNTNFCERLSDTDIINFLKTIESNNSPEALVLTRSEPLLRPRLILKMKDLLGNFATKIILETNLCNNELLTCDGLEALEAADYIGVNIDGYLYYKGRASRDNLFHTINHLLHGLKKKINIYSLDHTSDDFNTSLIDEIKQKFQEKVMIVKRNPDITGVIDPGSRIGNKEKNAFLRPCSAALCPFITPDGNIIACANQHAGVVLPKHLHIGSIFSLQWSDIINHLTFDSLLRAIRVYGPDIISSQMGPDFCHKCLQIDNISDKKSIECTMLTNSDNFKAMESYQQSKTNISSLFPFAKFQ